MSVGAIDLLPRERADGLLSERLPYPRAFVVALVLGIGLAVPLGAADGGYFPVAWGWAALPLAWVAGVALVLRRQIRVSRLEALFLVALGLLTVWIGLSILWSADVSQSVLELERTLVYLAGALAVVVALDRRAASGLVAGLAMGIAGICAYSLATRLFPVAGGGTTVALDRLQGTIGYWNGLAIFAAIGTVLAAVLAARAAWLPGRGLAAAAVVVTTATLYFTFSRGGWLALAVGVGVALAVDTQRLQLSLVLLVVAPFAAGGVLICSRARTLTTVVGSPAAAAHDGHRLALELLALALGAAAAAVSLAWLGRRIDPDRRVRLGYRALLAAAVLAASGVLFAHFGGPVGAARDAYHSFEQSSVQVGTGQSLDRRLFSLSSNGRSHLWKAAWGEFTAHPALGSGAGSFEQYWYRHRTDLQNVRDAHSLYLETLAELGIPGFLLLLIMLAAPLLALRGARSHGLAPALAAGYVAFLVHAGMDWDWELPAITLVGLACGIGLLVVARGTGGVELRWPSRAGLALLVLLPLAGFSLFALVGNRRLSAAVAAAGQGRWQQAASDARAASGWMPWAPGPWHTLAAADAGLGHAAAAVADMRAAVRLGPNEWTLWTDLGNVSTGAERKDAFAHARALNPRDRELPR
jgi:O-Antigen ligase